MIAEGLEKNLYVGFIAKPFKLDEVRLMARRAVELTGKEGFSNAPHSFGG